MFFVAGESSYFCFTILNSKHDYLNKNPEFGQFGLFLELKSLLVPKVTPLKEKAKANLTLIRHTVTFSGA